LTGPGTTAEKRVKSTAGNIHVMPIEMELWAGPVILSIMTHESLAQSH